MSAVIPTGTEERTTSRGSLQWKAVVFARRAYGLKRSRHLNSGRPQIYRIFRWKRNGREVACAYEARPGLFKFGDLLRRDLITLVAPTVKLPPTFLSCAVHCRYLRGGDDPRSMIGLDIPTELSVAHNTAKAPGQSSYSAATLVGGSIWTLLQSRPEVAKRF
jgi:hypothetical protein